ncbi:hypothetical protein EX30DRAFT_337380 [Ascodesmis nigricans]|uniref:Cora-domain-containing protein n=1 Tax=Ascodesmis nigricans TaxID=341454 RepID=A0A4S2N6T9_9PEZI|nr:hypothetical protein EX30DRAFT_337380 [Ascodesmis nigricans]
MDPLLAPQQDPITSHSPSPPPTTTTPEPHILRDPLRHPYYQTLPESIAKKFRNLDCDDVFGECDNALKSRGTKNFIVDFGGARDQGGEAWCALDLDNSDAEGVKALLEKRRDNETYMNIRTRWINIFQPYEQMKLVSAITSHYNFSPRLTSVITTPPTRVPPAVSPPTPQRSQSIRARIKREFKDRVRSGGRDIESGSSGVTTGASSTHLQVPGQRDMVEMNTFDASVSRRRSREIMAESRPKDPNYMDLAQTLWHWHAVEWGNQYICTGFNHLHSILTAAEHVAKLESSNSQTSSPSNTNSRHSSNNFFSRYSSPGYKDDLDSDTDTSDDDAHDDPDLPYSSHFDPKAEIHPYGRRVWSWLVLCDDGTVISIHEPLRDISDRDLIKVRMNMLTVFRSLSSSRLATSSTQTNMGTGLDDLPFRAPNTESDTVDGGPSLLFYYLFDDWYSTFRFVYERGAPYSTKMSALRNSMRRDPHLKHLKKLHRITRRLASLKRMMETRKIILENILYRQEKPGESTSDIGDGIRSPRTRTQTLDISIDSLHLLSHHHHQPPEPQPRLLTSMGSPTILGVRLSPLSITKFERLRDRIRLYVLGELDSLLVEKTELENLTFNLISLKQSATVEVLTRITIWLTKFTFLFLPLTLVTGYFGMELRGFEGKYGEDVFWVVMAVSIVLTVGVLWVVGWQTRTEEVGRGVRDVWRGGKRRRER